MLTLAEASVKPQLLADSSGDIKMAPKFNIIQQTMGFMVTHHHLFINHQ
jgi:hypothetical protein